MKQLLPVLFLLSILAFPSQSHAVSFTISNPVQEGDYYIVEASLSGISSSSAYVMGMFTHIDSTDYFGFTWGQKEDWVEYRTTSKDFIVEYLPILVQDTVQKIWVKPNFNNPGYKGPGDYLLKLKRYTGNSDNSAGDPSNTLTISLSAPAVTEAPSPTATQTPTATPTPTNTPEPTVFLSPTRTPTPTPRVTTVTIIPSPSPTRSTPTTTKPVSPLPTQLATPSSIIISTPSASSTSVLGLTTSPSSTLTPTAKHPDSSRVFKYTFIFGVVVTSVAGGFLYFRHYNS